ncbi:hypothetical protein CYMTET_48619 [Cymbomonas tetramitiformis]|uniref:Major facilitator superfamily (MFS) profile domain-containing protein n=1 Tax=Cymbomonas tetramitiformis TaxID=36881 RepID=A0AAE0EWL4_9CHLO|nr:hypothetical protein CYMTET_48619 [Cymbomonas tetramitiformis]
MVGCFIKAGVPGDMSTRIWEIVLGTIFVGAAQPFFQITPPLLVARWFGSKERTAASGVCINANQIGIGFAFVLGPLTVKDKEDIEEYFFWIAMLAAVLCFGTCLQFRSFPPEPPVPASQDTTKSEAQTPMDLFNESHAMWSAPGFAMTVAAFCVSFTNTNVISSFLNALMHPAGYTNNEIGFTGALFQVAIMVGSILLGTLVDETRMYKTATVWLLSATTVVLVLCTYLDFAMIGIAAVAALIMLLGIVDGPLMPISSEAAVEVTYPANENIIMALQMVTGNLVSFCLLPVFHQGTEMARDRQQAFWLLILITVICGVVFLKRFDGKFARARVEGFDFDSFSAREGTKGLYGAVASTLCIEPSQELDDVPPSAF